MPRSGLRPWHRSAACPAPHLDDAGETLPRPPQRVVPTAVGRGNARGWPRVLLELAARRGLPAATGRGCWVAGRAARLRVGPCRIVRRVLVDNWRVSGQGVCCARVRGRYYGIELSPQKLCAKMPKNQILFFTSSDYLGDDVMVQTLSTLAIIVIFGFLTGCGEKTEVVIQIDPTTVTLDVGATRQFRATVTGTSNTRVIWQASGGTIIGSENLVSYVAPNVPGSYTITATSAADAGKSASASIVVRSTLMVEPSGATLLPGESQTFTVKNGKSITWNTSNGTINGGGNTITYTAPQNQGNYVLTATESAETSKNVQIPIYVVSQYTIDTSALDPTIKGRDTNQNGIRDDIDSMLATNLSGNQLSDAQAIARAIQMLLEHNLESNSAVAAASIYMNAVACARASLGSELEVVSKAIEALSLNSETRFGAMAKVNDLLAGQSVEVSAPACPNSTSLSKLDLAHASSIAKSNVSAQAEPPKCGKTKIYFGNGVLNSPSQAREAKNALESFLKYDLLGQDVVFQIAYNPTEGVIGDLIETFKQKGLGANLKTFIPLYLAIVEFTFSGKWAFLNQYIIASVKEVVIEYMTKKFPETLKGLQAKMEDPSFTDPVVESMKAMYKKDSADGYRVLVVAHSQGNLYANVVYGRLRQEIPDKIKSFAIAAIATPASRVAYSSGDANDISKRYVTSSSDQIINALRNIATVLPANDNSTTLGPLYFGHKFMEIYINTTLPISNHVREVIMYSLSTLEYPTRDNSLQICWFLRAPERAVIRGNYNTDTSQPLLPDLPRIPLDTPLAFTFEKTEDSDYTSIQAKADLMVSPLHQGNQNSIDVRGSLDVRVQPKIASNPSQCGVNSGSYELRFDFLIHTLQIVSSKPIKISLRRQTRGEFSTMHRDLSISNYSSISLGYYANAFNPGTQEQIVFDMPSKFEVLTGSQPISLDYSETISLNPGTWFINFQPWINAYAIHYAIRRFAPCEDGHAQIVLNDSLSLSVDFE